ncbi:MAG: hypothetical protein WAQ08_05790 [Aquabacterium sp.]|uniref:hypothetical protein n=1 Tax=Aquabacterium sp. TaxID=1872578 RepID=UPI003BB0BD06
MTYLELLDAAKRAKGYPSDYRLTRELGVSDNTMYNYRHGLSRPDEIRLMKLCEMAGLDPTPFIFDLHASRAKTDELKEWWATLGKRTTPAVLALMFCLAWWLDRDAGAVSSALAYFVLPASTGNSLYIMSTFLRWLVGCFSFLSGQPSPANKQVGAANGTT